MTLSVIEKEVKKMRAMAHMLADQTNKVEKYCALMQGPLKRKRKRTGLSEKEEMELLASLNKNLPPPPKEKPPQEIRRSKT